MRTEVRGRDDSADLRQRVRRCRDGHQVMHRTLRDVEVVGHRGSVDKHGELSLSLGHQLDGSFLTFNDDARPNRWMRHVQVTECGANHCHWNEWLDSNRQPGLETFCEFPGLTIKVIRVGDDLPRSGQKSTPL